MAQTEQGRRNALESKVRRTLSAVPDAGEVDLQCEFLQAFTDRTFPYAADAEWQYEPGLDHLGRGDLVFASARNVASTVRHSPCMVLIIEVKSETTRTGRTARVANNNRRNYGAEQVQKSMEAWKQLHPNDDVWGAYYSNRTGELFEAESYSDPKVFMQFGNPLRTARNESAPAQQTVTRREEGWSWGTLAALGTAIVGTAFVVGVAMNEPRHRDQRQ